MSTRHRSSPEEWGLGRGTRFSMNPPAPEAAGGRTGEPAGVIGEEPFRSHIRKSYPMRHRHGCGLPAPSLALLPCARDHDRAGPGPRMAATGALRSPPSARSSASATASPGPTGRRPTATSNELTGPCSPSGLRATVHQVRRVDRRVARVPRLHDRVRPHRSRSGQPPISRPTSNKPDGEERLSGGPTAVHKER